MAEYSSLKDQVRANVFAKPFTRIPGKPTWEDKEKLIQEAEILALDLGVSYDWAGEYGLLAEVQGAAKYLVTTTEVYVAPVRPDVNDP